MQTQILQHSLDRQHTIARVSFITRFFNWCAAQENNRFGWAALIIALHGCLLTPVTALSVLAGGNNIIYFGIAVGAMAMSLVTNLAAMPTRVIIPVFFLSVLIDIALIVLSLQNVFA